jgi:uncharacterized protein (TIGR03083 family)
MSIEQKVSLTIQAIDALTELCTPLTEAQWKTATDCPGWSVQDNISHLVGIENMLLGKPPTTHKSPKYDYIKNPIGEHNEHEIDARRSLPGSEVFAEWKATAAERAQQLRTADAEYFAKPMMMPTGPGTLGDFLDIRILDLWIHDQDIRRALNIAGNHGGPCAEHTIDRLIRTLPIVVGKRAATPEGESISFTISGAVQRAIYISVTEGRANIVASAPTTTLCEISMDSTVFTALATGRKTHAETVWTSSGDAELAQRIVSQLNMMI